MHKWNVSKDFKIASKAAAEFLAESIRNCVSKRGVCHIVLPGGRSPEQCLQFLSEMELPWEKIDWYVGDERVLPEGNSERNDVMIKNNLWSKIPSGSIHTIQAELGGEVAAKLYNAELKDLNVFDIAFLGMGEDGHTASLFPGNVALNDIRDVVPVYNSPKPPDDRVTISIKKLSKARIRMVLTGGILKAGILSRIKKGEKVPINIIGDVNWFVDEASVNV